jgi:archaetidylinositol phosphate synthase
MVLNKFRPVADKIISSQVSLLVRIGVKPNLLSFIGLIFAIFASLCFAIPQYFISVEWGWVAPFLYFLSGYLDLLDGGVARVSNNSTKFGGFLDSTLDRIADSAILVGLMIGNFLWNDLWWGGSSLNYVLGYLALTITILISYTRSRAENEGVPMKSIGLMERGERFFSIFFAYIIELILRLLVFDYNGGFFPIFFLVYILLCTYTVVIRIVYSYRFLTGKIPIEKNEDL